jgi:hypothetical protein
MYVASRSRRTLAETSLRCVIKRTSNGGDVSIVFACCRKGPIQRNERTSVGRQRRRHRLCATAARHEFYTRPRSASRIRFVLSDAAPTRAGIFLVRRGWSFGRGSLARERRADPTTDCPPSRTLKLRCTSKIERAMKYAGQRIRPCTGIEVYQLQLGFS